MVMVQWCGGAVMVQHVNGGGHTCNKWHVDNRAWAMQACIVVMKLILVLEVGVAVGGVV